MTDLAPSLAARVRTVPAPIRVGLLLVAFAVAFAFCATDSGPYRLFRSGPSEDAHHRYLYWQAIALTIGTTVIPAFGILLVLARRYR